MLSASLGQMPLFQLVRQMLAVASRRGYLSQLHKVSWGIRQKNLLRSGVLPVPSLQLGLKSYPSVLCTFGCFASKGNADRIVPLCCGGAFVSCLLGGSGQHMPSGQDIFLSILLCFLLAMLVSSKAWRWEGQLCPQHGYMVGWQV